MKPRWTNCLLGALAIRRRFGGRLVRMPKRRLVPHFMVYTRDRMLHCTDSDLPANEQGYLIRWLPWLCCKMHVRRIRHPKLLSPGRYEFPENA